MLDLKTNNAVVAVDYEGGYVASIKVGEKQLIGARSIYLP